jgi:hypothetical protein
VADSKRLQILKALTAQLETISIANGYMHDLTGGVHRGRPDFGSETDKPYIGIFEVRPEELPNRADETVQEDQWVVGIQGTVQAGTDHPTDPAHNLLADIKRCLAVVLRPDSPVSPNPYYMFDNLIADMKLDGGITFVPVEDQSAAVCVMKLTIDLVEELEDPFDESASPAPGVVPGSPVLTLDRAPDYIAPINSNGIEGELKAWFFPGAKQAFLSLGVYGSASSAVTVSLAPLPDGPDVVGQTHMNLRASTSGGSWVSKLVGGLTISSSGNMVLNIDSGANIMLGCSDQLWYKMK